MSRKRNRQLSVQTSQAQPQNLPDARHEVAARASKALRSVEAMKLRQNLIQVYNQELLRHEQVRINQHRPSARQGIQKPTSRRNLPTLAELRRSPLSPQVRDQLSDGIRALACESRRTRKEVIFALRRAGKNGRGNKRAKWTWKSKVRCR